MTSSTAAFSGVPWMKLGDSFEPQRKISTRSLLLDRRTVAKVGITVLAARVIHPITDAASAAEADSNTATRKDDKEKKTFADIMETGMQEYEENMVLTKKGLFSKIESSDIVADIGIGAGPNLRYMPEGVHIIGVDPNKYMQPYAKQKADALHLDLTFKNGVCEKLPLADESCDVVITTLTLCSVQDPSAAISEVLRVLKPGGYHLFIEHVIAAPKRPVLRTMQRILNPLQKKVCDGCNLSRETANILQQARGVGYSELKYDTFDARWGQGFVNAISPLRPHIAGFARKAPQ